MLHRSLPLLVLAGCAAEPTTTDSATPTTSTPTSTPTTDVCAFPLVHLETGPDPTCSGAGNTHVWPVGMAETDCHGWQALDNQGEEHQNSANQIRCNPDGSFTFTQFAGNLDCSGTGVVKTYTLDACEQDIPPSLYTQAVDLTCCHAPDDPACTVGVPTVSVPNATVYLNGTTCAP